MSYGENIDLVSGICAYRVCVCIPLCMCVHTDVLRDLIQLRQRLVYLLILISHREKPLTTDRCLSYTSFTTLGAKDQLNEAADWLRAIFHIGVLLPI